VRPFSFAPAGRVDHVELVDVEGILDPTGPYIQPVMCEWLQVRARASCHDDTADARPGAYLIRSGMHDVAPGTGNLE
jgi:hypothetical protein